MKGVNFKEMRKLRNKDKFMFNSYIITVVVVCSGNPEGFFPLSCVTINKESHRRNIYINSLIPYSARMIPDLSIYLVNAIRTSVYRGTLSLLVVWGYYSVATYGSEFTMLLCPLSPPPSNFYRTKPHHTHTG